MSEISHSSDFGVFTILNVLSWPHAAQLGCDWRRLGCWGEINRLLGYEIRLLRHRQVKCSGYIIDLKVTAERVTSIYVIKSSTRGG